MRTVALYSKWRQADNACRHYFLAIVNRSDILNREIHEDIFRRQFTNSV